MIEMDVDAGVEYDGEHRECRGTIQVLEGEGEGDFLSFG